MSFHYHARRVRDPERPPWRRLSSLRACVASYCRLTGAGYRRMLAYLDLEFPQWEQREPPTDDFLRHTLEQVERERNRSLERLRAFERRRIRAKEHGNRQLSTAEGTALRELRGAAG